MLPVKCLSSSCTTALIEWRNRPVYAADGPWTFSPTMRVVTAEVAFFLLNGLAIVETVAYGALALISKLFTSCTARPYAFFLKRLESSSFTWMWTAVDMIANLVPRAIIGGNLLSRESGARQFANTLPLRNYFRVYRPEDELEVEGILPPPPSQGSPGARLLVDHVFANMEPTTATAFRDVEAGVVSLVVAKVVFLYTLGALRDEPISSSLRSQTVEAIEGLRDEFGGIVVTPQFVNLFNSQDRFAAGLPTDHDEKLILQQVIGAAGYEMQHSRLLTQCWAEALPLLPPA